MKSQPLKGVEFPAAPDTQEPSDTEPYEHVLEFTRAQKAEDPYGFHFQEQDYWLRTAGGAVRGAPFPWSKQLLADLQALAQEEPDAEAARRMGEQMRRFLDALDWGGQEGALARAPSADGALRLVLRSAAAELYALPWELVTLKDSGLHLAEIPGCTLRYEWPQEHPSPPRTAAHPGGRVLFAWSAAGGLVPAEEHLQALQQACREGDLPFDARRDVLSRVSLSTLEEQLRSGREPVSVLHVLCHGAPLKSGGGQLFGLSWNGMDEGAEEVVDGGTLAALLAPYSNTLRMVVLCTCQGGDSGTPASYLGSVAQALHRANIETVLASRLPLSSKGSVRLAQTLYRKLLVDSASLDEALGTVRRALRVASTGFDWASLQLYARREGQTDLRPVLLRPYRGLLAFEPRHRRFFFGRRALEAELLERVQQAAAGQRPCFQVVAGASGTGKSSVAMAGLVPLLSQEEWDWLVVRPGELVHVREQGDGERSVALRELRHRMHQFWSTEPLPERQDSGHEELREELRRMRQAHPGRRLLLVLDQLEEIFTQLPSHERQALMRGVWALALDPARSCVIVATFRVDHLERCGEVVLDERTRLDSIVYSNDHRLFIAQMTLQEIAEAIEQPARKVGLELEPGLVDRLCKDAGEETGSLPLLAHALDLLWQRRQGRWLTHRAYEEMGGLSGALSQTAEQLYAAASEDERRQARRLLVRLVVVRDLGSPRVRGRVWVEKVRPQESPQREVFDAVLEKLVSNRLLVSGGAEDRAAEERGAWVQLAHEMLLRRWKRLAQWVEEDWEREQQVRELEKWAEDWEAHQGSADGGTSYLLTGDRLERARLFRQKLGGELPQRCLRLIEESHSQEEQQRQKELTRHEKDEEMMRAVEEARVHARSTARILRAAQAGELDTTKGLLILREVEDYEKNKPWLEAALTALQQPATRVVLGDHGSAVTQAAFSLDGQRVLTAPARTKARVWSTDGTLLATLGGDDNRGVLAFSPDGQYVVTASYASGHVWGMDGRLLATLSGNESQLSAVTFSPNSQYIVAACRIGTAWVWSVDGRLLTTLNGHEGGVVSITFSPDGQHVVTASEDTTARVWSIDGRLLATLKGHEAKVLSASFSPDSQLVLTASADKTARVWSIHGELLNQLEGHSNDVLSAAFSPDGQMVVTASADRTARVWRTRASNPQGWIEGHGGRVVSAVFSPDSTRILTASDDKTARLWSIKGGLQATLKGHGDRVVSATFSRDGRQIVTASQDGTARIWSTSGTLAETLEGHEHILRAVAFSPDGARVVTVSDDRTARVWSVKGSLLALLKGHSDAVLFAAFSPDGQRVVTASGDQTARVWSVAGEPQATLVGHRAWVRSVAFSPDGKHLLTASDDWTAQMWSLKGVQLATLSGHRGPVVSATFSPDGQHVLTASDDKTARVWTVEGTLRAMLGRHNDKVTSAAFSPDGKFIVTASWDEVARIWSADGRLLAQLEGHGAPVLSAAFSLDSKHVVTASGSLAWVWSVEGQFLAQLKGHADTVVAAVFSPDGKHVLTASHDATARLWSIEGKLLATLLGHRRILNGLAFSPDGKRVATASDDNTARVWPLDARLLMEKLQAATRECLGIQERQSYLDESPKEALAGYERCQLASPAARAW